jgi:hypothetical protein
MEAPRIKPARFALFVPMSNINLRSLNIRDNFIRHSGFRAKLTPMDGLVGDFSFALIRRGENLVALRSGNFPDRFLRHRNFEVHLDPATPDDQFRQDSTFRFVTGLADPSAVSFQSVNFPDRFIRHRDFLLWVEAPNGPGDDLFRRDATFFRQPAAVLIDEGTALNPVDG